MTDPYSVFFPCTPRSAWARLPDLSALVWQDPAALAGAATLLAALIATGVRLARRPPSLGRADARLLAIATAVALALRLAALPTLADVRSASTGAWRCLVDNWSAAWAGWLRLHHLLLGPRPDLPVPGNLLLGTLTVALLYVAVVEWWEDRAAAAGAAAVLAVLPAAARYSASDSAHVLYAFALVAAAVFVVRWRRAGAGADLALAAAWLAVAVNARPDGVFAPVAAALVAMSVRPAKGKVLSLSFAAAALALGAASAWSLWDAYARVVREFGPGDASVLRSVAGNPFFRGDHAPTLFALAAVAGAPAAIARRGWRGAAAVACALLLVNWVFSTAPIHADRDTNVRYGLPSYPFFALLAGAAVAWPAQALAARLRRPEWQAGAAAALVLALAALPSLGFLRRTWTFRDEAAWLRPHLAALPDECIVVAGADRIPGGMPPAGLQGDEVFSREVGRRHLWVGMDVFLAVADLAERTEPGPGAPGAGPACVVAYEAARCHVVGPDGANASNTALCRRVLERYDSTLVAAAELRAAPYVGEHYRAPTVPTALRRLVDGKGPPLARVAAMLESDETLRFGGTPGAKPKYVLP